MGIRTIDSSLKFIVAEYQENIDDFHKGVFKQLRYRYLIDNDSLKLIDSDIPVLKPLKGLEEFIADCKWFLTVEENETGKHYKLISIHNKELHAITTNGSDNAKVLIDKNSIYLVESISDKDEVIVKVWDAALTATMFAKKGNLDIQTSIAIPEKDVIDSCLLVVNELVYICTLNKKHELKVYLLNFNEKTRELPYIQIGSLDNVEKILERDMKYPHNKGIILISRILGLEHGRIKTGAQLLVVSES